MLALLGFLPWLFSWTGLMAMVIGVPLFGQGINLGYHRLLAHRSLRVPKWFERFLVIIALCNLQGNPGNWVATHRFHHKHADRRPDPHSPLVSFLWAHIGWLVIQPPKTYKLCLYQNYGKDVLTDPFYMYLEKTSLWVWIYMAQIAMYGVLGLAMGWLTGGNGAAALRLCLSLVVWGVVIRTVIVWHITWSVNSLTHLFGYRTYETDENSQNNWFVALIGAGEGWHNNHHHDPASASVQHRWWEVDPTYYVIRVLEWLGLANKVIRPKDRRCAAGNAKKRGM